MICSIWIKVVLRSRLTAFNALDLEDTHLVVFISECIIRFSFKTDASCAALVKKNRIYKFS